MLNVQITHFYEVECYGPDGNLKWQDTIHNLVTTTGLNKYLDATLSTGSASPAWYVGLVKGKTTGYAAGDTIASHGGWTEAIAGTDYTTTGTNRITWTPGSVSAGSVSNTASKAVFPILQTLTISGAMMCSAQSGTTGTLLGVGDFAGGDKSVANGDTLNVTVTCSMTSA